MCGASWSSLIRRVGIGDHQFGGRQWVDRRGVLTLSEQHVVSVGLVVTHPCTASTVEWQGLSRGSYAGPVDGGLRSGRDPVTGHIVLRAVVSVDSPISPGRCQTITSACAVVVTEGK